MRSPTLRHPKPSTAALLAAALALGGCSNTASAPSSAATDPQAAPHTITFQVTGHGTATLAWPGGSSPHAALPWRTTTRIPLGADGLNLSVQLDATGGQATCAISVDGRRVVSSLAQGAYGRATCHTAQVDG
jgi:hypothetical protein